MLTDDVPIIAVFRDTVPPPVDVQLSGDLPDLVYATTAEDTPQNAHLIQSIKIHLHRTRRNIRVQAPKYSAMATLALNKPRRSPHTIFIPPAHCRQMVL